MKNYSIRHVKDRDYIIRIRNVKNDCHFTFSHFFARAKFNNNAIAVYKSDTSVVLIHEIKSSFARNSNAIYMSKKRWSKVVAETDDMSDVQSLKYLLKKYFLFQNESSEQQEEREYNEFLKTA